MNNVSLVGEVTDRPFRPGNGNRTVVKIKVHGGGSQHVDRFEFDAFGQPGEFAMRLYVGDIVAVTARLEDRTFREEGEDVNELRIVAQYVELVSKSSERRAHDPNRDTARDGSGGMPRPAVDAAGTGGESGAPASPAAANTAAE